MKMIAIYLAAQWEFLLVHEYISLLASEGIYPYLNFGPAR